MISIIIYALLGRLTIYLAQSFPFQKLYLIGRLWNEERFLGKLFACDLCLGVWVYWILALLLKVNVFDEFGYIPILFEFFTGVAMSFIVHLIHLGWNSKFMVYEIK
jgi:hypothetical protein